jgi:predicted kinase
MVTRYPRTPHLPWSPGVSADDIRWDAARGLQAMEVVVTEKLDGENTTLYRDRLHARSPDSAHHPSRTWLKAFHDRIRLRIPEEFRVCGENVFARHSLAYDQLESWFYLFSVWHNDFCLDWDSTVAFGKSIGAPTPRLLYRGIYDEKLLRKLSPLTSISEGYVVRPSGAFRFADFANKVAKWVRPNHVTTHEHWRLAPVVENRLGRGAALWSVRSGRSEGAEALFRAIDPSAPIVETELRTAPLLQAMQSELDAQGCIGEERLEGVLAALLWPCSRTFARSLLLPVGASVARRSSDLLALYPLLHRSFPDERRPRGLRQLSLSVSLPVLHALASSSARLCESSDAAFEQVEWSRLVANDAGLWDTNPLEELRADLAPSLRALPQRLSYRIWAAARMLWVEGQLRSAEQAVAATFTLRAESPGQLTLMVGPAGSGKSTVTRHNFPESEVVSLDALREQRGSRKDQSANAEVLQVALIRLEELLRQGRSVVWDATSLSPRERRLPLSFAERWGALTEAVVFAVDQNELERRNRVRKDPIPERVLRDQYSAFRPPFLGEVDLLSSVGKGGSVEDTVGGPFT